MDISEGIITYTLLLNHNIPYFRRGVNNKNIPFAIHHLKIRISYALSLPGTHSYNQFFELIDIIVNVLVRAMWINMEKCLAYGRTPDWTTVRGYRYAVYHLNFKKVKIRFLP